MKLDAETPYLDLPMTKNERPRRVSLSVRAVLAFRSIVPEESNDASRTVLSIETGRGIIYAFRDVITEKAFSDLRWHDLRHEGISRLFELTDLRDHEIMAITGHLTLAMLARYPICAPIALAHACQEGHSTDARRARRIVHWHDLVPGVGNWRNAGE